MPDRQVTGTTQTAQAGGVPANSVRKPVPKFAKDLDADQQGARLSASDKLQLSLREQATPYAFLSEIFSAGWEHLTDGDPRYGSDSAGFGERLGAAAIRQTSQALFADGVFAAAFHQDPRYYRMKSGPVLHRALYAASRTLVTRMDSGRSAPNYSLLAGYGAASALTLTYYPAVSATGPRTAEGYVLSVATNMLGNQYHEFGPDLFRYVFHRHQGGEPKPAKTAN